MERERDAEERREIQVEYPVLGDLWIARILYSISNRALCREERRANKIKIYRVTSICMCVFLRFRHIRITLDFATVFACGPPQFSTDTDLFFDYSNGFIHNFKALCWLL